MITFLGPEGAGKTTLAQEVAHRIGGIALVVTEWPTLHNFLEDPHTYAMQNQEEALQATVETLERAKTDHPNKPWCIDMDPTRVLVYSSVLREQGHLSAAQKYKIDTLCSQASSDWPNCYTYLKVGVDLLLSRLEARGRADDLERNSLVVPKMHAAWENAINDPAWQKDKHVLHIANTASINKVAGFVIKWAERLPSRPIQPTMSP